MDKISNKKLYIFFLGIYLICLPLNALGISGFGSALKLLSFFPILIALLDYKNFKNNSFLKVYFLFALFSLFSFVWSYASDKSLSRALTYFSLLLLMSSTCFFDYNEKDAKKIKQCLIWSSRISAVIVLVFGTYSAGRLLLRGVLNEDPNYYCAYLMFAAVAAVQTLISNQKVWRKAIAITEIAIYIMIILLTGSRGGLLAVGAAVLIFLLFNAKKQSFKTIFKKTTIIVIVALAYIVAINQLDPEIAERFTIDSVVESGGTHRTEIWLQGLDLFSKSNFLRKTFGYGSASIRVDFAHYGYYHTNVMHNIFLETLVEIGVAGLLIYLSYIIILLVKSWRLKDRFAFAIMIGMIVLSVSTSIYAFKPYVNIMIFISMMYRVKRKQISVKDPLIKSNCIESIRL